MMHLKQILSPRRRYEASKGPKKFERLKKLFTSPSTTSAHWKVLPRPAVSFKCAALQPSSREPALEGEKGQIGTTTYCYGTVSRCVLEVSSFDGSGDTHERTLWYIKTW